MPSLAQSQKIDRSRLEPLPPHAVTNRQVAPLLSDIALSPLMICSLPNRAAGYDAYARQFYGRTNVPQQRLVAKPHV